MKELRVILVCGLLAGLAAEAGNRDAVRGSGGGESLVVSAVYVDSDGVKWFGTNRGLLRYNDLTWRYYTDADFLAGNRVNALVFEQTGTGPGLWVATTKGVSLVHFDSQGITSSVSYTADDGLLSDTVTAVAVDSHQAKFFGAPGGITWFHNNTMEHLLFADLYSYFFITPVRSLEIYNDTLYIAQDGGVGRFVSGVDAVTGASRWEQGYGMLPYSDNIFSTHVQGAHGQWFGSDAGVETHTGYFAKDNWGFYSTDSGLVHNEVISIAEDAGGGMWFGTTGGVSLLDNGTWTSYTTADGLLNDTVSAIGFDTDGSVWFGTASGACRLRDGVFQDFINTIPDREATEAEFIAYYSSVAGTLSLVYRMEQSAGVMARLYDISGRLAGEWQGLPGMSGEHRVELPLDQVPGSHADGIFVLQLIRGNSSAARKIMIRH
jgi:hypothetical protein